MPQEIEHKFLVRMERLPRPLPKGKRLEQGYLSTKPSVRVRLVRDSRRETAFITIKGEGLRQRDEFEYAIPPRDARKLLKLCGDLVIKKIRRNLGPWEVDQFLGRHKGLWLAELELKSARNRLPKLPPWVGKEVTRDRRFANSNLAQTIRGLHAVLR
jgi:adenylate cyclase